MRFLTLTLTLTLTPSSLTSILHERRQWLAVAVITCGIIASSVDEFQQVLGHFDVYFLLAVFCCLAAALCDAVMYVVAERALFSGESMAPDEPITANELCGVVGLINLLLTGSYIAVYSILGEWDSIVVEPIAEKGGDTKMVAILWSVQALVYYAHYASFYQCILSSNSVAAHRRG